MVINNSTSRFSNRVADYIKYRPGYPREIYDALTSDGLNDSHVVADIGSGTGILSKKLVEICRTVYGIEPNDEMRMAAEQQITGCNNFVSLKGTEAATSLETQSVNYVFAAQAYHWFDPELFRKECLRILKPGGKVAIIFNSRRTGHDEFHRQYEQLIRKYATDYHKIDHKKIDLKQLELFYGHHAIEARTFDHFQSFDMKGLQGRLLSSSYIPKEENNRYHEMLLDLLHLYGEHHVNNRIEIKYDTKLYLSHLL